MALTNNKLIEYRTYGLQEIISNWHKCLTEYSPVRDENQRDLDTKFMSLGLKLRARNISQFEMNQ